MLLVQAEPGICFSRTSRQPLDSMQIPARADVREQPDLVVSRRGVGYGGLPCRRRSDELCVKSAVPKEGESKSAYGSVQ